MENFLVVCTNDKGWADPSNESENVTKSNDPKKGQILTVIQIVKHKGNHYYCFEEINTLDEYGNRECYNVKCFRRITPQKFQNELTKMLADKGIVREGVEIIKPKRNIPYLQ
jgi:hypothetical protein